MTDENQTPADDPLTRAMSLASSYEPALPAGKHDQSMPDDVRELIAQLGIEGNQYTCTLREKESGGSAFIARYESAYPSEEEVLLEYGPGSYEREFVWTEDGESRKFLQPFVISEKLRHRYEEHQEKKEIDRLQHQENHLQRAQSRADIRKRVRGLPDKTDTKDPIEYLRAVTGAVKEIGLGGGGLSSGGGGLPWKEIAALVAAASPFLVEMVRGSRERSDKMMMALLGNNNDTYARMVDLLQTQGGGNTQPMVQQFTEKLLTQKMQELLEGPTQTEEKDDNAMDKIMSVVEQALPIIGAALKGRDPANSMPAKMARTYVQQDEDFQTAMQDPEMLKRIHGRIAQDYGPENAELVMRSIMGQPPPSNGHAEPPSQPAENRNEESEEIHASE